MNIYFAVRQVVSLQCVQVQLLFLSFFMPVDSGERYLQAGHMNLSGWNVLNLLKCHINAGLT